MPKFKDKREPERSQFKTFNFFVGDVISFNYGFGCHDTGTITYISPRNGIVVNGSAHEPSEPSISQVKFLAFSPARMSGMKLNWVEKIALWLLGDTEFFNKVGSDKIVKGMTLYTYGYI